MQRLGQHFLKNKSAIQKIIAAIDPRPNDTIIEIGPGTGALTFPLFKKCEELNCKIIAIEKDPQLARKLGENFQFPRHKQGSPASPRRVEAWPKAAIFNFQLVKGDALKELPGLFSNSKFKIQDSKFKLVGNIPYYITGKLLRIISGLENKPESVVLMVQKEVAERIVAKPPRMNLLAAATQFWAEPKILFTLKPEDFDPPPEVDSAVIALTPNPQTLNPDAYYRLIRIIFKQPRKTLLNNLRSGLNLTKDEFNDVFSRINIDPNARPQDLSVEKLAQLATIIKL